MGPSGSGKSMLLDLLTGRKDLGRCDGEVLFRGRSIANQQVCTHLRSPEPYDVSILSSCRYAP